MLNSKMSTDLRLFLCVCVQVREPDPAVRVEAARVQRLRGAGQRRRHCQGQGPQHAHQPKESLDTYIDVILFCLLCMVFYQ